MCVWVCSCALFCKHVDIVPVCVCRYSHFPQPPVGAAEVNFRETKHSGGLAMLRLYHEAERPVVVHYWYKSCAMCKVMKPVIQRVVNEYAEEIYYVDVEISANKKTMKYAGVRSIPAIQVYKRGKVRPRWPFPRAGKVTAPGRVWLEWKQRCLCMRVSLSLSLSLSFSLSRALSLCLHARVSLQ